MTTAATLRLAFQALVRNKLRSVLTVLGVAIGVAAVILTVAIGAGARISVQNSINALGPNLIVVQPGSVTQGGARSGLGDASSLTPEDGLAIAKLSGVRSVSPQVTIPAQVVAGSNNWHTTATGVAPTYTLIRSWAVVEGRFIGQGEVAGSAKVAVLGATVDLQLFPSGQSPVGATIMLEGVPFTVIGRLRSLGQSAVGQDQDDTVLIPYTSAMKRLTGLSSVNALLVSAAAASDVDDITQRVTHLLEQRHRIIDGRADDFAVQNLQSIAQAASQTGLVMEFLLAGVGAVSLLVGGIGIMNIMVVSVTERTREIGLRMAVGANGKAILNQFLAEAVVLASTGGVLGVATGVAGMFLFGSVAHWPMSLSPQWIIGSVLLASMVGIFFGYYPARKAARLNPIAALRFE